MEHSGSDFRVSLDAPGSLLGAPGVLWGGVWGARELFLSAFWTNFLFQGGLRSRNGRMLENDIPYSTFAMFLRSQGLKNEVKMLQKRQKREKRREEREQRREKKEKRRKKRAGSTPGRLQGEAGGPSKCTGGVTVLRCEEYYEFLNFRGFGSRTASKYEK